MQPPPQPHTHVCADAPAHTHHLSCRSLSVEESRRLARENARDLVACGCDVERTFIFSDFEYVGGAFYRNMLRIQRCSGGEDGGKRRAAGGLPGCLARPACLLLCLSASTSDSVQFYLCRCLCLPACFSACLPIYV